MRNFPFVPYQFILMQKVFAEIRKHGNSGKHLSGGERSMLSGFQEAAQKIKGKDEYALAPFYLFYDTVHTFLDSSIRRVIERCERAAADGNGIESQDVDVLKLLYLVRYVDDMKANLDNIVILMADDIRLDKIIMREQVHGSLDRLMSQNYIGRTGEVYNFLTDEEQDIQREIYRNTTVDTASIVERIGHIIFGDIYTTKKYRYGKYDFAIDQMVDTMTVGAVTGGMRLRILTVATDTVEKSELRLMVESSGQAVVVLSDTPYYESLENAMKIRKYVKQRNVAQLPKSVQDIIRDHQDEAGKFEITAAEDLKKAIETAEFYVDGEHIEIKGGDAKSKLDQALEYLVTHVYSDLNLIRRNAETDADIITVLTGGVDMLPSTEPNRDAAAKVEEYLEMQHIRNLPTSMADVQSRYQAIPYGWKEIDIAAVVAQLIHDQKVTIKYGGTTIQPTDPKLPDMLRKKSEIGRTSISKRQVVSIQKIREVREFLRDYFDEMDVPEDEDGLIAHIVEKFSDEQKHCEGLLARYEGHKYPDMGLVSSAVDAMKDILSQQRDNTALIDRIIKKEDDLYGLKDKMQNVESFFKNQVSLFDSAVKYESDLRVDLDYIAKNEEANKALNTIRLITMMPTGGSFNYARIPELNGLMATVREKHGAMLEEKRAELLEIVRQCMAEIHTAAGNDANARAISDKADTFFAQKKAQIAETKVLALLDGLVPPMWQYKDEACDRIETLQKPPVVTPPVTGGQTPAPAPKKVIKTIHRQAMFPAKTLETEADIDAYVEKVRTQMKQLLNGCDGIRLS